MIHLGIVHTVQQSTFSKDNLSQESTIFLKIYLLTSKIRERYAMIPGQT